MGLDSLETKQALKDTKFSHLSDDFQKSGFGKFRMFKPLVYNGQLLKFLYDFEKDSEKRKELAGIITSKVKQGNAFVENGIKYLVYLAAITFILWVVLVFMME